MCPMRTADESQPLEGGADSTELGDGYKSSVSAQDLSGGFGDDLDDSFPSDGSDDGSDGSVPEGELDEASVTDLSESEAEEVLVDIVEEEGFSSDEAEDIVDDLQADTGMSATELLEDYVQYSDSGDGDALGFDGSSPADDPFLEGDAFNPLDLPSDNGLDPNHDGQVASVDAHSAPDAFDFDLDG
jgi:hypothetical protein